MGALFSKKEGAKKGPSRVTEQDKAVLKLKQTRDKLKQYQKKIVLSQEKEREVAKECLRNGRKDKAMRLLKKKKYQDTLLAKTDTQLDNLDTLVNDLEFAQVEVKVMEGLKGGNEALSELHKIMTLDDVEKIMGDTEEAVAYQREIDDIMAGGVGAEEADDDELLAELDVMLGTDVSDMPDVPVTDVDLPDVPSHVPDRQAASGSPEVEKRTLVAG